MMPLVVCCFLPSHFALLRRVRLCLLFLCSFGWCRQQCILSVVFPSEGFTNPGLLSWMCSSSLKCLGSTLLGSFWYVNLFLFIGYPKLREKFAFVELPEVPVSLCLQPPRSCLALPSWYPLQTCWACILSHDSFVNKLKRVCPSINPWGMPQVVTCQLDIYYSHLHMYKRPKNRKNHLRMWREKADVEK